MTFAEYLSSVVSSGKYLEARVSINTTINNGTCTTNGTVTEYLPGAIPCWRVQFDDGVEKDLD